MKSIIISIFVSLLHSRLTSGVAIPDLPTLHVVPTNNSLFADNSDTHCSNDFASYGQIFPGSVACILATYELLQSPRISTIASTYPHGLPFLHHASPRRGKRV